MNKIILALSVIFLTSILKADVLDNFFDPRPNPDVLTEEEEEFERNYVAPKPQIGNSIYQVPIEQMRQMKNNCWVPTKKVRVNSGKRKAIARIILVREDSSD
jgi:hypothetical protein